MKKIKYIIIFFLFFHISCIDDDNSSGLIEIFEQPELNDDTEYDKKIKQIFEKYNTYIRYDFTETEWKWDWSGKENSSYCYAKKEKILEVVDLLNESFFDLLPDEFLKRYSPLNIYLADSLKSLLSATMYSTLSNSFVAISPIGAQFDKTDKTTLKEAWVSIFIEKMLDIMPYPNEFAQYSGDGYDSSVGIFEDVVKNRAILKKSRKGLALLTYPATTVQQDFGDYVAFIMHRPSSKKNTDYNKNDLVKIKEEEVKKYFLDNFAIKLPEAE